jgi:hypothetical protein
MFCDFTLADCTAEYAASEMRSLPSVTHVETTAMKSKVFDSFSFPVKMTNQRALIMAVKPLLKIEKHLTERMGSAGEAIIFEGKDYARSMVAEFREILENLSRESTMQNVVDGLRAMGFGLFEFASRGTKFKVTVKHPPTLDDMVVSHFIVGFSAGILAAIFGGEYRASEIIYDKHNDGLVFILGRLAPTLNK